MTAEPFPAVSRTRRYRERQKRGVVVVSIELDTEVRAALFEHGLLVDEADKGERGKLVGGVGMLLFALAKDAIKIDFDELDRGLGLSVARRRLEDEDQ